MHSQASPPQCSIFFLVNLIATWLVSAQLQFGPAAVYLLVNTINICNYESILVIIS